MLKGQLTAGMAGMTMPTTGQKHLEVHICTRGGAVVKGASPHIVLSDPVSRQMAVAVPVAVMEGVKEGASDLHYGNNVTLAPGHRITVKVSLKGQVAVLHATVPRSSRRTDPDEGKKPPSTGRRSAFSAKPPQLIVH